MAASDASEALRHDAFREIIQAGAIQGSFMTERGYYTGALEILEPAHEEMMRHYDGGTHFHVLIEHQRLLLEQIGTGLATERGTLSDRYAEYKNNAGTAHLAAGRRDEASQEFRAAMARACNLRGDAGLTAEDRESLDTRCEMAETGLNEARKSSGL